MASITASMVKELRDRTGMGMMDVKKALVETDGDMKKAEDLLRIKTGTKANKVAGRIAAEGAIGIHVSPDASLGALVEVNCETDFVAKDASLATSSAVLPRLSRIPRSPTSKRLDRRNWHPVKRWKKNANRLSASSARTSRFAARTSSVRKAGLRTTFTARVSG